MKSSNEILERLKSEGFRITKARKALLELLELTESPISVEDICVALGKKKIQVNKTTIYRELDFLKSRDLLEEIQLEGNMKLFEGAFKAHHHHLYCLKCKNIEDVEMDSDLDRFEKEIERKKNFKIQKHKLEFFGLCSTCK